MRSGTLALVQSVVEDSHASNGGMFAGSAVAGGGLALLGGDASFVDVQFTNTSVTAITATQSVGAVWPTAAQRWAFGGAVAVATNGLVRMRRVRFQHARAVSKYSRAWGGAIGIWSNRLDSAIRPTPPDGVAPEATTRSRTLVYEAVFDECTAAALRNNPLRGGSAQAFGGAVGLFGGYAEVHDSEFLRNGVSGVDAAFGGALGAWVLNETLGATSLRVLGSSIMISEARAEVGVAAGAALGVQALRTQTSKVAAQVALFDVTTVDSKVIGGSGEAGQALATTPLVTLSTARLSLHEECDAGATAALIDAVDVNQYGAAASQPGEMMLRSTSFNALSCPRLVGAAVTLLQCDAPDACAAGTTCTDVVDQSLTMPTWCARRHRR